MSLDSLPQRTCHEKALSTRFIGAVRALQWVVAAGLCVGVTSTQAFGQAGKIELYMADQTLSASIRNARLQDVISKIENDLGIWVRGTQHVTDETLSVEFESMPMEQGLDRILSSTDHSLVFDEQGDVLGVILISSASAPTSRRTRRAVRPRTLPNVPRRTLPQSRP